MSKAGMQESKTIHFVSLGCAKNRVDTEVMLGVSGVEGYRLVHDPAEAEVIVVNTCGFIESAKQESIDTMLELGRFKEEGRCRSLVMAGCLAQRYADDLAESMPEVDHFLGSSDMLKLAPVLQKQADRMLVGNPADYTFRAEDPRALSLRPHSVYMKIAEGCNRSCSFCAIPAIRGKQRSRAVEDLCREAEWLAERGAVELNLVSQDTIAYGRDRDERPNLATLVQALAEVKGIRWIRLHYLYPESLTKELVELLAEHPKVLPYIDMPLQHASDRMLKTMRRGHGGERLRRVVDTLRTRIADLSFRTTFLVGHPGESEEDFAELCEFVQWAEFDHIGVFRYSDEEGTLSATQEAKVPKGVGTKRQRKLLALQRPISRKKLKRWVGREVEVLVDGPSEESEFLWEGRHAGQALEVDGKVILTNDTARSGEFRRARIVQSADYDLVGELLPAETNAAHAPDLPRAKLYLPTL